MELGEVRLRRAEVTGNNALHHLNGGGLNVTEASSRSGPGLRAPVCVSDGLFAATMTLTEAPVGEASGCVQ